MTQPICSHVTQQLPFLLHGELSEEEKRPLLNHLSGCSRCQRDYERLHKTFDMVQSWKREPENFDTFNQALFHRIRESRPDRTLVLRPAPFLLRPAVLVPVLSICLLVLTVGLWQQLQGQSRLARSGSLTELALLEVLEEELPEVAEETLGEEILLLDEILLSEATTVTPEKELLKEFELLEELGEGEDLEVEEGGVEEGGLEEELLSTDEAALG